MAKYVNVSLKFGMLAIGYYRSNSQFSVFDVAI